MRDLSQITSSLNNVVVEALTKEHAAKIVNFYIQRGYDTQGYVGTNSKENQFSNRYYGIVDQRFGLFTIDDLDRKPYINLARLEDSKQLTFPREMLVWNLSETDAKTRVVLHILDHEIDRPVIAVNNNRVHLSGKYTIAQWNHAKEIEHIETMTLEQVCQELGRKIIIK